MNISSVFGLLCLQCVNNWDSIYLISFWSELWFTELESVVFSELSWECSSEKTFGWDVESSWHVPDVFLTCSWHVPRTCPHMFLTCSWHVPHTCSSHVPDMFLTCSSHVPHTCPHTSFWTTTTYNDLDEKQMLCLWTGTQHYPEVMVETFPMCRWSLTGWMCFSLPVSVSNEQPEVCLHLHPSFRRKSHPPVLMRPALIGRSDARRGVSGVQVPAPPVLSHGLIQRDACSRRRSFTASFVGEDKSAEISPARLMARQIMAHVAAATGVPRVPLPTAAAHLKAV